MLKYLKPKLLIKLLVSCSHLLTSKPLGNQAVEPLKETVVKSD